MKKVTLNHGAYEQPICEEVIFAAESSKMLMTSSSTNEGSIEEGDYEVETGW